MQVNGEKILHSEGHQRGSQSNMGEEKMEEEEDRLDQEKRENRKGRQQSSQQSILYVLSTVWNTHGGSQSYIQKRRRRRQTEVTRRRRGGIKRGETKCSLRGETSPLHSPEHPERFTELSREEKGVGGDRGDLGVKKES